MAEEAYLFCFFVTEVPNLQLSWPINLDCHVIKTASFICIFSIFRRYLRNQYIILYTSGHGPDVYKNIFMMYNNKSIPKHELHFQVIFRFLWCCSKFHPTSPLLIIWNIEKHKKITSLTFRPWPSLETFCCSSIWWISAGRSSTVCRPFSQVKSCRCHWHNFLSVQ